MNRGDAEFMRRALELALRGRGHTRPNPPVGALIVKGGEIIAGAWHKKAGGDHAEVAALKKAGDRACGATLYVTLEPCSKPGRVGACTEAIAKARVARVVFLASDPNPKNRGGAKKVLKKAGIECEKFAGDKSLARAGEELLAPFAKHIKTNLPFVTVKIAISLDGKICDDEGQARWVSSPKARRLTGKMREWVDAIMVGAETIRRDDPSLLSHGKPNEDLVRVVVSASRNLPPESKVFADSKNKTLVFDDAKKAILELGRLGYMHVLCEGGLKLARSLAKEGLVDEWLCVLAPKIIADLPIEKAIKLRNVKCLLDS